MSFGSNSIYAQVLPTAPMPLPDAKKPTPKKAIEVCNDKKNRILIHGKQESQDECVKRILSL